MKKINVSLIFLISTFSLFAGDLKYPVSAIPAELKENVDVVVREDFKTFVILSKNHSRFRIHFVATILNEKGNDYANDQVYYDKFTKVVDINGAVYDLAGKQIKKLKNKDIYDQAAFDGGMTLFSDSRIKILDLAQSIYPYTVEIDYEVDYKYLLSIRPSSWGGERISYEKASYELIYPKGFPIKYKLTNTQKEPIKSLNGEAESLTWTFEKLKPINVEPLGPRTSEILPHLFAIPTEFEYGGYPGKRDTWENFGKWQIDLNKGRDAISERTIAIIKNLTADLKTDEEKAKVIYEFLQSRTRYVNVSLGIGGLQPIDAKSVDEVGYGDCKALSNYMVALLKVAGVRGYYTWIYGGYNSRELIDGLTYDIFNHIVVAVPNGRDTLWLECTSQNNPFGYQGNFTGDRKALMITEDGGKLVNTIKYPADINMQSRTATVEIDNQGNATARIRTANSGTQFENGGLSEVFDNTEKQKKWIERNTDIPNFSVNSFTMKEVRDKIPSAIINLDLTLSRYASVSGKRLFLSPNLMNKNKIIPPKLAERKTDVVLRNNYLDYDTIKFTVPENLYPEFMPEPVKINSKFGEYSASFQFDAGKVTYIRRMKMWKGRYPKETYNDLIEFYKNVSKADNIKLVFLNKT